MENAGCAGYDEHESTVLRGMIALLSWTGVMASYLDVARYFVCLAESGYEEDPLTPLRLHKLMYYAQGWALAALGRPLFGGHFEAWQHGPVHRELYPLFRGSSSHVSKDKFGDSMVLSPSERSLVDAVWKRYGIYSPGKLLEMTHNEPPWKDARGDLQPEDPCDVEITHEALASYFGTQLDATKIIGLKVTDAYRAVEELESGQGKPAREVFARLREHQWPMS